MAHFAQLGSDGKTVMQVIVVNNDAIAGGEYPESEPVGQEFIARLGLHGIWLQCSYSGSFRSRFPGEGFSYDADLDEFVAPVVESEPEA
jgi:hypothetical protein